MVAREGAPIFLTVEGQRIEEPDAYVYFTPFPSHHPILDQVYQLMGQEIQFVLEGDFHKWHNVNTGTIQSEALDTWIWNEIKESNLLLEL